MTIQADLTNNLKSAFDNDLSDAVINYDLITSARNPANFDTSTGVYTPSETTYIIRGIKFDVNAKDIHLYGAVAGSFKMLFIQSELTVLGANPKIGDKLKEKTGALNEFTIYKVKTDPVKATLNIFCKGAHDV